jgi:hypothetical protein
MYLPPFLAEQGLIRFELRLHAVEDWAREAEVFPQFGDAIRAVQMEDRFEAVADDVNVGG